MKITICVGSSCHMKGSRCVVEKLKALISQNGLTDRIELGAAFCAGQCQKSVCVGIDEELFSVSPDTVEDFFTNEVKTRLS